MPFYEIEFPLTGLDTEAVETALLEGGAISMTFLDLGACAPRRRPSLGARLAHGLEIDAIRAALVGMPDDRRSPAGS
jgi:hypothetical protein